MSAKPTRISDRQREEVWSRTDFHALVSELTELSKTGVDQYVGCCPFHEEQTPSFNVNTERKVYKCFGCDAGGDLFSFVMRARGCNFRQAFEFLDSQGQVLAKPTKAKRLVQSPKELSENPQLLGLVADLQADLARRLGSSAGGDARAYLDGRGISAETIARYGVGLAPAGAYEFTRSALKSGASAEDLVAAGISSLSKHQTGYYDYFRDGRITFPIADAQARVRGFSARLISEQPEKSPPSAKYVNSRASEIFQKGSLFFGHAQALVDLESKEVPPAIIVTEGYVDVLALAESELCASVSVMGTSGTAQHAAKLAASGVLIYLAFDGDQAGRQATKRFAGMLASAGAKGVCVVELPPGEDPASLVAAGQTEQLRELLSRAAENSP